MQVSPAEWQVMKVIWTKNPITSHEVIQALGTKFNWTDSTVKTLLGRLVTKKVITAELLGNKNYYSPLLSEADSLHQITQEVIDKTCALKLGTVIGELISNSELTAAELDKLTAHLTEKRQVAVNQLTCQCI